MFTLLQVIPGTERGHFYEVAGRGKKGLVGVREVGHNYFRVRIQGWPKEGTLDVPEGFEVKSDYHASRGANKLQLADVIQDAIDYITG